MTDQTNAPETEETERPEDAASIGLDGEDLDGEVLPPENDEPRTDLIVPLRQSTVIEAFSTDEQIEALVSRIETEVRKLAKDADAETKDGRQLLISLASKVARSKTFIDGNGKVLTDEIRAKLKPMEDRRRLSKDRLDALKEEVRGPITKLEEAEAKRKEALQAKIAALMSRSLPRRPRPSRSNMPGGSSRAR